MSEKILDQCKASFPDLNVGAESVSFEAIMNQKSVFQPELNANRNDMLEKLGLAPSGSLLIDHARLGKICNEEITKANNEQMIKTTIAAAETKVAEAVFNGNKTAKLMDLGVGIKTLDTIYRAPELSENAKRIIEGVNKSSIYQAEVKMDPSDKKNFYIEVSMKNKN